MRLLIYTQFPSMGRVFVSYRHTQPDQALAARIEEFLTARGVPVFSDAHIQLGEKWSVAVDTHLARSRFLVVLLSEASLRNRHVQGEIRRAHKKGLMILPLRLDSAEAPYEIDCIVSPLQIRHLEEKNIDAVCAEIFEIVRGDDPVPEGSAEIMQMEPESGTVRLGSPFYVRRTVDSWIEARLRGSGSTIVLRGARQVGKSSLLVRAAEVARSAGRRVSRIDFQLMDNEHRQSLGTLLRHLAYSMAADLAIEKQPDEFWNDRLGFKPSITKFVEQAVLMPAASPVVLCLDEVDTAFGSAYCADFFSLLRSWHETRAVNPLWDRLHLVITHSTDPAPWIHDLDQSPFNVGERQSLREFSADQVRDLSNRYGVRVDIEELMQLVGGHPFLVRKALFAIRTDGCPVAALIADLFDDSSPFRDHLQLLSRPLHANAALRDAMRQVLIRGKCDSEVAFQRLLGAGLVKGHSREEAAPRCDLYRAYFEKRL
jgi:hypothetical protein